MKTLALIAALLAGQAYYVFALKTPSPDSSYFKKADYGCRDRGGAIVLFIDDNADLNKYAALCKDDSHYIIREPDPPRLNGQIMRAGYHPKPQGPLRTTG